MDLLCCCLEAAGIYYLCRLCQGRRQQQQQQAAGGSGGYAMQAPNRSTMAQPAPAVRGPARYERTSNVLGARETPSTQPPTPYGQRATSASAARFAQPQPPSEPKKGTVASLGNNTNNNATAPSSNTYSQSNQTGYRLGDSQPVVHTSVHQVSEAPPTYEHALSHTNGTNGINHHTIQVDPDPASMTLSEQVAIMPAASVTLVKKILANAIDSPDTDTEQLGKDERSRRKINMSNPKIQQQIAHTHGALEILQSSGFTVVDMRDETTNVTSKYLYFAPGTPKQPLMDALAHLNSVRPDVAYVTLSSVLKS